MDDATAPNMYDIYNAARTPEANAFRVRELAALALSHRVEQDQYFADARRAAAPYGVDYVLYDQLRTHSTLRAMQAVTALQPCKISSAARPTNASGLTALQPSIFRRPLSQSKKARRAASPTLVPHWPLSQTSRQQRPTVMAKVLAKAIAPAPSRQRTAIRWRKRPSPQTPRHVATPTATVSLCAPARAARPLVLAVVP